MRSPFSVRALENLFQGAGSVLPRLLPVRLPWGGRPGGTAGRRTYAVKASRADIRHFTARGELTAVSQVLIDGVSHLNGPLGVVLVELQDPPREWVASRLGRAEVLESLMALRDLWGRGGLDLAVYSSRDGIEIFLDRFGTLEVRSEAWFEPRLHAIFTQRGFTRIGRLASIPSNPPQTGPGDGDEARVTRVRDRLGMKPTAYRRGTARPA